VNGDPSSRHMLINLPFPTLPTVLPEPALISRDRQRRPKLQHPVLTLGDLNLRPRLIEMQPTTDLSRQRHNTTSLNCHKTVKRHATHHPTRP